MCVCFPLDYRRLEREKIGALLKMIYIFTVFHISQIAHLNVFSVVGRQIWNNIYVQTTHSVCRVLCCCFCHCFLPRAPAPPPRPSPHTCCSFLLTHTLDVDRGHLLNKCETYDSEIMKTNIFFHLYSRIEQ